MEKRGRPIDRKGERDEGFQLEEREGEAQNPAPARTASGGGSSGGGAGPA